MTERSRQSKDSPEAQRTRLKRLLREKASRPTEAPLSFGQERLWFLDQLAPGSSAYCETVAGRLVADVHPETLARALNEVVRRHAVLRTTFATVEGRPVQRVAPELSLHVPVVDLTSSTAGSAERELESLTAAQSTRPFDLRQGPLLRLTLIRLKKREYFVVLTFHHIVGDAWSVGLFLRELFAAYWSLSSGSPVALPELPIQYTDFARWQRRQLDGDNFKAQLAHLKRRLSDVPRLELPTDRPRTKTQSFEGATHSFELTEKTVRSLESLGRHEGATLFMVILTAFKILMSRHTGSDDVVVGTPVVGRSRTELESLIGFFVNMVVLRTSLRGNPTLRELLRRVRHACLDAYANQDVPYEKLVAELRPQLGRGQELVRVVFAHYKDLLAAPSVPGIGYEPVHVDTKTSKFDLSFYSWKDKGSDRLNVSIDYSTDLFDATTIARMASQYQAVLREMVGDPDRRLPDLSVVSKEELDLLRRWRGGESRFPSKCLHLEFETRVERSGDSVAVVFEGEHLSYEELNRRANQLARRLSSLGVGPDARVGLYAERSPDLVVGMLGILKAGGAYVPLDTSYPADRVRFMLEDSGARVVVTHSTVGHDLPTTVAERVLLDDEAWALRDENDHNPEPKVVGANLAYVIYTSGSTGRPKGVAVPHVNVARLFGASASRFGFGETDTWTLFHSHAFDFSVWEIFGALLHGGRLVVFPRWVTQSPKVLYERLWSEGVTVLNQTPSAFRQLQKVEESQEAVRNLALRFVIFGGEALRVDSLAPWFERHGDEYPRIVNMYGITETTVHVTHRPVRATDVAEGQPSGIGRSLPDLRIHVLDQNQREVPIGVSGEIYVGGPGLARGYLGRPDLTAERFLPDPFDALGGERLYRTGDRARWTESGELRYLGRVDHQVKIRGFRIELGEIESVLRKHPGARQAVVVTRDDPSLGTHLAAFVVGGTREDAVGEGELRRFLAERLPDYMVPSIFEHLDALPLTPGGKIDRAALPEPAVRRPRKAYVAPRNATEWKLAQIWTEVLGVDPIGVEDDFFELGGHSFLAVRLASRIGEAFSIDLPLLQLFERPTIAAVAHGLLGGANEWARAAKVDPAVEAVLDPSIRRVGEVRHVASPTNVLLTGSTGFLGAFLLHELLARTQANVYCLVRAQSLEVGRDRIRDAFRSFSLAEDEGNRRIIPVPGDLARPHLGLSAGRFEELASQVEVIYHSGAMVSAIYPYSVHKPTNVLGTQEVLRLACEHRVKPLHYVSTTGVFPWTSGSQPELIREDVGLDSSRFPTDGYSQSKWVAERLVAEARTRGLPVSIYRPGRITGHSCTGASNDDDLFSRIVRACIQMGKVPKLAAPLSTDIVPVDYVSKALVILSMREESIDRVFHLVHPHPIDWRELIELVVTFGYPVEQVTLSEWIEARDRYAEQYEDAILAALDLSSLARPDGSFLRLPEFASRHTLDQLQGTPVVCPPIDEALLNAYLSRWIQNGQLQTPSAMAVREPR